MKNLDRRLEMAVCYFFIYHLYIFQRWFSIFIDFCTKLLFAILKECSTFPPRNIKINTAIKLMKRKSIELTNVLYLNPHPRLKPELLLNPSSCDENVRQLTKTFLITELIMQQSKLIKYSLPMHL